MKGKEQSPNSSDQGTALPREVYYSNRRTCSYMNADIDVLKEGIEGLIRAGYYRNREALLEDAFRTMIEVRPSVKMDMAFELYKSEKISLSRAAEIAGTSLEGFKRFLEFKGRKRIVVASSQEKLQKGVDLLLG
jgi:predicted HTH domain antitoxin